MFRGEKADKILMSARAYSMENIKKMAGDIQFVSFDTIKIRDQELKSHWYKSENIDLYYFQNPSGALAKFHISLFGQILEWAPMAGLRTGFLIEEELQSAVSELIQYDQRANPTTVAQAKLVLNNASSVESGVRDEILNRISDFQNGKNVGGPTVFQLFFQWVASSLDKFR